MKKIVAILLISLGVSLPLFFSFAVTGTIDSTYKYAWSNNIGWINFGCSDCGVQVTDSAITGYAWAENLGWINLSPTGGGGITNSNGDLSGSAWGETADWIDFANVTINSTGQFTGTATGDVVGTVVFSDCGSGCGVKTNWTPSGGGESSGGPGGTTGSPPVLCYSSSDCGTNGNIGGLFCQNDNVHQNYNTYTCNNPGTAESYCSSSAVAVLQTICPVSEACNNGACVSTTASCSANSDCGIDGDVGGLFCLDGNVYQNYNTYTCNNPGTAESYCSSSASGVLQTICSAGQTCNNGACVGTTPIDPTNPSDPINPNPPENPDNPFSPIIDAVAPIGRPIGGINEFIKTVPGTITTTMISTIGIIGNLLYMLSLFIFAPGIIFEIFFIPLRLASLLGALTGIRRKIVHWGIVYDSQTKRPLDPVRVALVNIEGKEIASTITDVDGRYGFLVDPGLYKITARKTHYDFPSKKLAGRAKDEVYEDLYFGEQVEIKAKGEVIKKNIPLDPLGFDWNEFAKSHGGVLKFYSQFDRATRLAADIVFAVGFIASVWAYFAAPAPYNVAIVILYLGLLTLRVFVFRPKSFGYIARKADGLPLSFAQLKIFSPSMNIEVGHKITDAFGRYYCLIPKGKYYVKIEEREQDNSYKEVFVSPVIDASRKGIIKDNFKV